MSVKSISIKGIFEIFEITAYTGNKKEGNRKEVGKGNCTCFSEKPADLDKVQKAITVDYIAKLNRQIKTDKRNGLASVNQGKKLLNAFKTVAEFVPALRPLVDKLKAEIAQGDVNKETIKAIEGMVKNLTA